MQTKTFSKEKALSARAGITPAVCLINPKSADNVGKALRLASSYGIKQLWWTGNRVRLDTGQRLPREERMRGYRDVEMIHCDTVFDHFAGTTIVAIEVRNNSEFLPLFVHPENALYVFGPEDGGLTSVIARHCHRFVIIPGRHCLNLATAVSTVLYDRWYKRWCNGLEELTTPGDIEDRGPIGLFDNRGDI